MCRMLGLISSKKRENSDVLFYDECSLFHQSKCKEDRLQGDGWGFGYYVNGNAKLIKSPNPIFNEKEKFISCTNIDAKIILAHVRKASNPRGLTRELLISLENTQPFSDGKLIFMHNGTITIPDEILGTLGEYKEYVKGSNDSEVLFWLFVKNLNEYKEVKATFEATIEDLWDILDKVNSIPTPYIGLNCIFSDGNDLYALCKHDHVEKGLSLCFGEQEYYQLCYKIDKNRLVIASEKTEKNDKWE
ncbi:MAG: class II glutamine amidotransferase, partial [Candidatus Thermoplasmatota archaeon]